MGIWTKFIIYVLWNMLSVHINLELFLVWFNTKMYAISMEFPKLSTKKCTEK